MLIRSGRHRPEDLELWAELEAADLAHDLSAQVCAVKAVRAMLEIRRFAEDGACYCSVSWGKDSVVLADLVWRANQFWKFPVPLIWVRVEPIKNPHCIDVRDAFMRTHPGIGYHEIEVWCEQDADGWHAKGTLESGFRRACEILGTERRFAGIRADEAGHRKISMAAGGLTTKNSCRPIGWWTAADVFAYLAAKQLPVHPNYAMLGSGRWERDRIRVASLGGRRGDGLGRLEFETEYYGDVLRRLETAPR